jgi:predicted permease
VTDRGIRVYRHGVSPGFFSALGAGLVNGRDFDTHDATDAPPVAIVSRRIASKAWPGLDPIGRRFTIGGGPPITIVGVAADLRYRSLIVDASRNPEDPDIYWPFAQRPERTVSLVVSTAGKPAALITAVRDAVHAFDRDTPAYGEETFTALVAARMATSRLSAGVMSCFGLVALLLAGIGVYGLINYSVMQRRQEMGVRLALGAGRREIYGLVLEEAWRLTLAGVAIGVAAALPAARLLGTQLYGVTPNDPATYASISGLLLTVALGAALLPARRAARVDPMVALRAD